MKGTIIALAVAGALSLAGCGGGSKGASMAGGASPTPTPTFGPGPIPLPQGHTLQTGTITIPADESLPVREADNEKTVIRCSAGSENCRITVAADGTVTLLAGSLRIEIQGVRVVTPTTPHPIVIEPPSRQGSYSGRWRGSRAPITVERPLIDWQELPTLVSRMNSRTQVRSNDFPGPSCDGGVVDCQAVVKDRLATAAEQAWIQEYGAVPLDGPCESTCFREVKIDRFIGVGFEGIVPGSHTGTARNPNYYGAWLDNSIFMVESPAKPDGLPVVPPEPHGYFSGGPHGTNLWKRAISMGIKDTNPVVGVYRGRALADGSLGSFELTYERGATEGQLSMQIYFPWEWLEGRPAIWSNISVDNEGAFDNGIQASGNVAGPNKLEGRFYQGGEVGGVFVYGRKSHNSAGAFGGKLVPDGP